MSLGGQGGSVSARLNLPTVQTSVELDAKRRDVGATGVQ